MNKKGILLSTLAFGIANTTWAIDYSEEIVVGLTITDLLIGAVIGSALILVLLMVASFRISDGLMKMYDDVVRKGGSKMVLLLVSLGSLSLFAQDAAEVVEEETQALMSYETFLISLLVLIWILIFTFIMILVKSVSSFIERVNFQAHLNKGLSPESYKGKVQPDILKQWSHSLTDAIPLEHEDSVLMEHEYDGIRELDNSLPPWWKWMFYVTAMFAVVYLYHYHVGEGLSSAQEYEAEVAEAKALKAKSAKKRKGPEVTEETVTLLKGEAELGMGKKLFKAYCKSCHGAAGQGGDGPNLTDKYWLYGGDIKDVFKTMKYGNANGMPAWGYLDPYDLQQIASYVISIEGTNPANAKPPQGQEYDRNAAK